MGLDPVIYFKWLFRYFIQVASLLDVKKNGLHLYKDRSMAKEIRKSRKDSLKNLFLRYVINELNALKSLFFLVTDSSVKGEVNPIFLCEITRKKLNFFCYLHYLSSFSFVLVLWTFCFIKVYLISKLNQSINYWNTLKMINVTMYKKKKKKEFNKTYQVRHW